MTVSSINLYAGVTALPPGGQESYEKMEIEQDSRFKELLKKIGSPEVLDISRFTIQDNGDREYIITTDNNYIIRVHLTYHERPPMTVGPKCFTLKFFEPEIPPHYYTGLSTR